MNNREFKINIQEIAVLVAIICAIIYTLPPASFAIFGPNAKLFAFMSILLTLVAMYCRRSIKLKEFLLFPVIVMFIWMQYRGQFRYHSNQGFASYFASVFFFFIPVLWQFNLVKMNEAHRNIIKKIFVAVVVITITTTLIGCILYPHAARDLAGIATAEERRLYSRMNIGSYHFIYGAALIFPYFIYEIKNASSKAIKSFYIGAAGLTILMLLEAQYVIALLLIVLEVYMITFYNPRKRTYFLLGLLVLLASILLFRSAIAVVLTWMSEYFYSHQSIFIGGRFAELAHIISGNGVSGDSGGRLFLYFMSLSSFTESPIWGSFIREYPIGGHSSILDMLAASGLIGAFLFMLIIYIFWRKISVVRREKIYKYIVSAFTAALVLGTINVAFITSIGMCLFLPPFIFGRAEISDVIKKIH